MDKIPMVDLKGQYQKIKLEIDQKIEGILRSSQFIKGSEVELFERNLASYLNTKNVIACANGTDALQLALMALELKPGDEVISPGFNYIACAETICLLGLTPVYVDVNQDSYNMDVGKLEAAINEKTKAIIAVHLYGQSSELDPILDICNKYGLVLIEDNAQSIGSKYQGRSRTDFLGNFGHIATTSFFPSKNLACYGDGGAVYTNDDAIAEKLRKLGSHGQTSRYYHEIIGINSRLDTLQAGILNIKLKYLDDYIAHRQNSANMYDELLIDIDQIKTPKREVYSTHVYHQYTIRVLNGKRDDLQKFLLDNNIASSVHYPMPIYGQEAYKHTVEDGYSLPSCELLSQQVLSLPIDTEISRDQIEYICNHIRSFFNA